MESKTKVAKGFTLIELLIVIGIIAILATIVVLTLNPAELLRQARDSTRLSDMATLKSALALYLADVTTGYDIGNGANCYMFSIEGVGAQCGGRFTAGSSTEGASLTANNGTGWLPINFQDISSGAPVSVLPIDPVNATGTADLFYAYRPGGANGGTCTTGLDCTEYEINANMESTKFENGGASDVESGDGGNSPTLYEVGTSANLAL